MGVELAVGLLADLLRQGRPAGGIEEELAGLDRALAAEGLPPHREPTDCPSRRWRLLDERSLHYLRRAAVHLWAAGRLPSPGDEDSLADPLLEEYFERFEDPDLEAFWDRAREGLDTPPFEHLMLHSDREGWYLPARFAEVLDPAPEIGAPGELIGSAPVLLQECRVLARALELPEGLDPGSDEVREAARSQGRGARRWQRYGIESMTCLQLAQAAAASVELGSALRIVGDPDPGWPDPPEGSTEPPRAD